MLNGGSDLYIFFDIMEMLREFFFHFTHLFEVPNKNRKYNFKEKIMKVEVKSS